MDGATLRIRLLGGFSVEVDGEPVPDRAWRLRKARALVKVTALADNRRVHREVVCELLWPERDAGAAANNLHQALHAARRALGDRSALALADDVLALTPDAWVDVDAFEQAARDGDPAAALALYAGELLPEDRFAEWTRARRDALEEQRLDVCVRAAGRRLAEGDAHQAVRLLVAPVASAPLHEPARRALMRALAAAGRRQDALAEFEALRAALREHSAAEPDPQTRALYRELLRSAAPGPGPPAAQGSPDGAGPRRPPPRARLPAPLTSFVGRERELRELHRLLDRARLVTLTGPGGAGKTRLALRLASDRAPELPDGAWLVDLGALQDPRLVAQAAATALGIPVPANRPALEAVADHAATLDGALIVLDTCEHVAGACAELAEALLAASPTMCLLATSREPLRCAAEVAWRVPALAEAPRLFRERAAAVRPGAGPWSAEEEAAIEAICWRLERMPLAIELAAARSGALTVGQIAARLDDALDVLGAGSRTALTRQQTLRATLDWSHRLLTDDERVAYRRLAVFAGAFTLEAAEAVTADGALPRRRVADRLARLVDKSLVVGEHGRFRLPDPIRQHAAEHLAAAGEREAIRRRHLRWCLDVARRHDPLAADRDARPIVGLEPHHDDLRAALAFGVHADPERALALATHLWRFWLGRSWFVEGMRWMDAVLAAAPAPTRRRVEALLAAAGLALRRGDDDAYLQRVGEAVALYRLLGDDRARAEALHQHALFDEYHRSSPRSAALFDEAVQTAERLGQAHVAASAVHASAMTPWSRSEPIATRRRLDAAIARLHALPAGGERFLQAVTLGLVLLPEGPSGAPRLVWEATVFSFRRLDRDCGLALALGNVAWAARAAGELDEAAAALEESLARARAAGDRTGEALALAHRGNLARSRGDPDAALADLAAGAARLRELGERRDADVARLGLGLARAARGDLAAARVEMQRALDVFVATDDLPAIAAAQAGWALVEERAGALERARDLYAGSVGAWRAQGLERFAAWAGVGLGAVLAGLGDRDDAHRVLASAHAALERCLDRRGAREAAALMADQAALSEGKGPRA